MTMIRTPSEDLSHALLALADQGRRPRCGDGETSTYWTADEPEPRALAAVWCAGCPIAVQCAAVAEADPPSWGVWAGRDYSTTSGKPRRRGAA